MLVQYSSASGSQLIIGLFAWTPPPACNRNMLVAQQTMHEVSPDYMPLDASPTSSIIRQEFPPKIVRSLTTVVSAGISS